jgi:H+/gluconate symporter-like permease
MFRQSGIPKRLIPCTVALGAFTFTMDSMPGSPQIQNIIPTTFFKTTTWAAPWLGLIGSLFILACGLAYIESRLRAARARGEGYGTDLQNEPEPFEAEKLPNPWIALLPLVVVGIANFWLTHLIPRAYGAEHQITVGAKPIITQIPVVSAIWRSRERCCSGF